MENRLFDETAEPSAGGAAAGRRTDRGPDGAPDAVGRVETGMPLAARMRPQTLDEVVGQAHLVGPGGPLRAAIERDRLGSVVLWGPPGTGKTSLAHVVAAATSAAFVELSAVTAGVKDVRRVVEEARVRRSAAGRRTVLFIDEIHRFNRSQQDALLPGVEDGAVVLIGATTENPSFEVNAPLLSRSLLYRLEPLSQEDVRALLERALRDPRGLSGVEVGHDALDALAHAADGDARVALNGLEAAVAVAAGSAADGLGNDRPAGSVAGGLGDDPPAAGSVAGGLGDDPPAAVTVRPEDVRTALSQPHLRYDKAADAHYDQVSALIKSLRGSDPDAALYWLVRMLASGEDPRFLARRMVILASEDVGLADPAALQVAVAAFHALELVGLPEARFHLAQAAVYLALAPKSNSVTKALGRADAAVTRLGNAPVPAHLRDAHYRSAARLGHGQGYRYPHDDPRGWVPQRYAPEGVEVGSVYQASPHGREPQLAQRWNERRDDAGADGHEIGS